MTAELRCDDSMARRAIDFMSGLTYALDGRIEAAAQRVFLLTPREPGAAATA